MNGFTQTDIDFFFPCREEKCIESYHENKIFIGQISKSSRVYSTDLSVLFIHNNTTNILWLICDHVISGIMLILSWIEIFNEIISL